MKIDGIDILIEGSGEPVVLLHGWPDTHRLWDAQVAALQGRYRCIRFTLPGFDPAAARRPYTLAEVVDFIGKVVAQAAGGGQVTLLLHDWGCFFGYQYALRHPTRVKRIIGVDVGDAGSRRHLAELGVLSKLMAASYQLWLAAAWRFGGGVGDRMARWMARQARAKSDFQQITSNMGWPYDAAWLRGAFRQAQPFQPAGPMLFIYGTRKPFMFHSRAWAEAIAARPGNGVLALRTGHWVMREAPEEFNAAVLSWLGS